jgi:hypothetical protein
MILCLILEECHAIRSRSNDIVTISCLRVASCFDCASIRNLACLFVRNHALAQGFAALKGLAFISPGHFIAQVLGMAFIGCVVTPVLIASTDQSTILINSREIADTLVLITASSHTVRPGVGWIADGLVARIWWLWAKTVLVLRCFTRAMEGLALRDLTCLEACLTIHRSIHAASLVVAGVLCAKRVVIASNLTDRTSSCLVIVNPATDALTLGVQTIIACGTEAFFATPTEPVTLGITVSSSRGIIGAANSCDHLIDKVFQTIKIANVKVSRLTSKCRTDVLKKALVIKGFQSDTHFNNCCLVLVPEDSCIGRSHVCTVISTICQNNNNTLGLDSKLSTSGI